MLRLYGTVLTEERRLAFDGEKGSRERMEILPVVESRVMFTDPKSLLAWPVVWRSVVTSEPDAVILRRSSGDMNWRRTW